MRRALMVVLALAAAPPSLERQMLDGHNRVRARLGERPLVWSDKLARAAAQWARTLIKDGGFRHNPRTPYGENLFDVTGGEYAPQQVVNAWAAEAEDYDHATNRCKPGRMCGHYTQLVWRETREVGCSVARGGNREVWVCEYYPPGNYIGVRPY